MITEAPPVQQALDELHAALDDERVDLAELVILGDREKFAGMRRKGADVASARRWLAARVRDGSLPNDPDVADLAKRHCLIDR